MKLFFSSWLLIGLITTMCWADGNDEFVEAEALWEDGKFYDAAMRYGNAITSGNLSNERLEQANYNVAVFFFMNFKAPESIRAVNKVLELNPKHIGAYCLRATASDFLGDDNQALSDWAKALELDPKE